MLTQTLQSMRVVKAYGQEANEARRFRRIVHNIRKYLMKATRTRAAVGPIWEVDDRASASRRPSSTAAGRGSTATSRSAQFMGFMTAALLAFQPMKALATHPGHAERRPARRRARLRAHRLCLARDREARRQAAACHRRRDQLPRRRLLLRRRRAGPVATSTWRSRPGRSWRWSGRAAPARARCSTSSCASSIRRAARS